MDFTGIFQGLSMNYATGKQTASFELNEDAREAFQDLKGCEKLTIQIKKYRKKRSLDANAYYWVLLSRLAEAAGTSKPQAHNLMLRRYGQNDMASGGLSYLVIPNTPQAEKRIDEEEMFHARPTTEIKAGKDGETYRTYILLAGSSTYDTKEMSELINGLVSECKEQGIETLPPEELARMMAEYEENHRKEDT